MGCANLFRVINRNTIETFKYLVFLYIIMTLGKMFKEVTENKDLMESLVELAKRKEGVIETLEGVVKINGTSGKVNMPRKFLGHKTKIFIYKENLEDEA